MSEKIMLGETYKHRGYTEEHVDYVRVIDLQDDYVRYIDLDGNKHVYTNAPFYTTYRNLFLGAYEKVD